MESNRQVVRNILRHKASMTYFYNPPMIGCSPYFPPERLVSGRKKNGTNLPPQISQSPPVSPGVHCFSKTKKHVKPLIYKHFTRFLLEAPPRLELGNKDFADLRLTTWLWRRKKWSGRRGSDSRPPPWQGGALPTELLPHEGALGRNRTTDTVIFSHMLYRLSYQGEYGDPEGARTLDLQRDRLAF